MREMDVNEVIWPVRMEPKLGENLADKLRSKQLAYRPLAAHRCHSAQKVREEFRMTSNGLYARLV